MTDKSPCQFVPECIFVYGTLMRGGRYHARYCPALESASPATAEGRLYALPAGYPAMVQQDGTVHGEALFFPDIDAALARIDPLEGYRPETPERSQYRRIVAPIQLDGHERIVLSYIYVYPLEQINWLEDKGTRLHSGRWSG